MTVKVDNTEEPVTSIKEKCVKCLKGPHLIRTVVVIICIGVVAHQITTCVKKLLDLPISTYTHFDFNKSITYPSITFCRDPPYKFDKMLEYGLYGHPRFTSEWDYYNFSVPLDQMWKDITYEPHEIFVQYGLNNEMYNLEVRETIGFMLGRCYTLSPKIQLQQASRESGLSITLQHNAADIANTISATPPGYHAFIHYTREPFTEVAVYNGGLVDYLYCNIGETIDVKLSVDQYIKINKDSETCTNQDNYSANECTTRYVWDKVEEITGCSGPWMKSTLPRCDNPESMKKLIAAYMILKEKHNCTTCPRFCRSYLYNGYVTNRHFFTWDTMTYQWLSRKGSASLQTQVFVHFNSMMVSVYEERYNYDWNLFISDLGGSVGFLLGLSVIGLMSIFGKFYASVIKPCLKVPKNQNLDKANKMNLNNSYY